MSRNLPLVEGRLTHLSSSPDSPGPPELRQALAGQVLDDGKRTRRAGMGPFFQVLEVAGSEKPPLEAILRPRFPPDPDRSAAGGPFRPVRGL